MVVCIQKRDECDSANYRQISLIFTKICCEHNVILASNFTRIINNHNISYARNMCKKINIICNKEVSTNKNYYSSCVGAALKGKYVSITKTRLFKYIANFTTKKWKFSDKKNLILFIFLLKI